MAREQEVARLRCYFCSKEDWDEPNRFYRIIRTIGRKVRVACNRCYNELRGA